jgi:hypothetical protein
LWQWNFRDQIHAHGTGFSVRVLAPEVDVDRLMEHVCEIMQTGRYDSNTWQSPSGVEPYRPLEGAAAGAETEVRKRKGVAEVSLELPLDQNLLEQVIEIIYEVHGYQEQTIKMHEIVVRLNERAR